MDFYAVGNFRRRQKGRRRAKTRFFESTGNFCRCTKVAFYFPAFKGQFVAKVHRLHDGF
jgi:hypothetical protein